MSSEKDPKKLPLSIKDFGLGKIVVMILAGIVILICSLPSANNSTTKKSTTKSSVQNVSTSTITDSTDAYVENMEQKLEDALVNVSGIGKVDVVITVKSSKEEVPLKDETNSQSSNSETDSQGGNRNSSEVSKSEETILSGGDSGSGEPYVIKELEPEVEGVLVICEGGGSSDTVSEINSIVQVLFDVPAHKIKVTKMN